MIKNFGQYFLKFRMVQRGIEDIFKGIQAFQTIEDTTFELGIVSKMDIENIRQYRGELMLLSTQYRNTAEDIGRAQTEVVKTGTTLKSARSIVMNGLALSRATYSTLDAATGSINKILLPLERTGEAEIGRAHV